MKPYLVRGLLSVPAKDVSLHDLESLVVVIDRDTKFEIFDYDKSSDRYLLPRTFAKRFGVDLLKEAPVTPRDTFSDFTPIKLGGKKEWEGQQEAVDVVHKALLQDAGAVLCAECGTGKTVMALELARRLGQATLILVHKEFLVAQWTKAIQQFFPNATVGRWQQDRFDSGYEADFVIGMIQSVTSKRKYPDGLYKSFGLIITDEVHRLGAQSWGEVIEKFPARYRLGVTATPDRRDGMQTFFFRHIGPIVHHLKSEREKPRVFVVNTGVTLENKSYVNHWDRSINFAKLSTVLSTHSGRNSLIAHEIVRAADSGRTIMVLSDRLAQLDTLMDIVGKSRPSVTQGKYVGGMKQKDLEDSEYCQVIYGTTSMAAEALNIPRLDTLFLVTPKTRIEQAVGRIQRTFTGKKQPVVVDFSDAIPICRKMLESRIRRYAELGIESDRITNHAPAKRA